MAGPTGDGAPIGTGIVWYRDAEEEGVIWLRVETTGGNLSSTGKMRLSSSTGGWQTLPDGFKFNLTGGRKA